MPSPIGASGTSGASYPQDLADWQAAFPASVASMNTVMQDGVVIESTAAAYQCGSDPEIDAQVCSGGVANADAGIIEIHDRESPADVARRTGQTNGWTLESFTRWWNLSHYTSKGLPIPPATPESQRQIANAFLQQQASDSTQVLHSWNTTDNAARIGNAIGLGTVAAATSFLPAGLFIDNPALLAKGLVASEVAPMLTSSGGPDGGMGSVIGVMAGLAAPALETRAAGAAVPAAAGSLENRALASAENALVQQGEIRAAKVGADTGAKAPAAAPQPSGVVVDAKAYQVAPGRDGRLQALGMEPGQARVVARASDGMGADFEVVTGGAARSGVQSGELMARPTSNPAIRTEPSVAVDPSAYRAPSVIFDPPGGDAPRLITAIDNQAYYRSTGSVVSTDSAGIEHVKEAGQFYRTLGAQEPAVPDLRLQPGWLIKGEGLTSSGFMPRPVVMPGGLTFEPQMRLTTPAQLNAWLEGQGVPAVGDAAPLVRDAIQRLGPR